MIRKALVAWLFVVLGLVSVGPTPAQEPSKAVSDGTAIPATEAYRIGPDDLLQVSVWKNESLSRSVPVRPDGKISLPLVNDVEAAGLTPAELRSVLTKKLAEYISDPEVFIIVQEVRSFKVSVIGEVARPGRFDLRGPTTVLDVLAQAGGLSAFASRSRIVILRREGNGAKRIPFNYNKILADEREDNNLYLRPGDIVVVP